MGLLLEIPNFLKIKNAFFALENAKKEQAFVLANIAKKQANLTAGAATRTAEELVFIDTKRQQQIAKDQTTAQNRVDDKQGELTALSGEYQAFLLALASNPNAQTEFNEHRNGLAEGLASFFETE